MIEELEALRDTLAPEIPPYARSFREIREELAKNGRQVPKKSLHEWLSDQLAKGNYRRARRLGQRNILVYWKVR